MRRYDLWHRDILVGILRESDIDFPWITCKFEPTSAFEEFRPLFERAWELSNAENWEECDRVWKKIEDHLDLVDPEDPDMIGKYLLHIKDDWASFRFMSKAESQDL